MPLQEIQTTNDQCSDSELSKVESDAAIDCVRQRVNVPPKKQKIKPFENQLTDTDDDDDGEATNDELENVESDDDDYDKPVVRSKKIKVPSLEEFTRKVKKETPLKWDNLDTKQVYAVEDIEEKTFDDSKIGDGLQTAYVGLFRDRDEKLIRVWLPGVVSKSLLQTKDTNKDRKVICIRPLGKKVSEKSKRSYQNFLISLYDSN